MLKSKQSQSALEKIKELADKNISEAFEYVYSIKVADMNWKREGIILNDKLLPREEVYALQKLVSIKEWVYDKFPNLIFFTGFIGWIIPIMNFIVLAALHERLSEKRYRIINCILLRNIVGLI